jgi:hypothetical protein
MINSYLARSQINLWPILTSIPTIPPSETAFKFNTSNALLVL